MDLSDLRAEHESDLSDYYECRAVVEQGGTGWCNNSAPTDPRMVLAVVITIIIYPGIFIWVPLFSAIKNKIQSRKTKLD